MKSLSKRFKFGGGFVLLFSLVAISPVGAQTSIQPPLGMTGWWPGDGGANDIIGGNSGALQGGAFFSAAKVGPGFTFDSDDDRVTIPHNATLDVNSPGFTAEFWMRGIKNQPHPIFAPVDKSHGFIDNTGWVFQGESAAGSIAFLIGAGGGPPFSNFPGVGSALDVLDGSFHHIAGTWDGNTVRLYVDGALQGTASLSTPFNNTRALNIGFAGGGSPTRFFRGQVDELSIYSRALSQGEIQAIVNAGIAGKDKEPPVGGSVTGVTPSRVVCINVTTKQTVQIQDGAKSWNCEAAGLVVNPGNKLLLTILGLAD